MLHVPILRGGRPYRSLSLARLRHVGSQEPIAEVSQANPGLIARDIEALSGGRRGLASMPASELLAACVRAARLFREADLPLDAERGPAQSPEDYIRQLSATSGLPQSLCRINLEKIHGVLAGMEQVLDGLTRGLDLTALDGGFVRQDRRLVSYQIQSDTLGAILPGNSPGVHSLWIPAVPLKASLVLKPGAREPWTPLRITQALIAAGCPAEGFGVYPTDHAGAAEILLRCPRSMLFGDASTVGPWRHDPRVQIHGPGWSKVLFGEDQLVRWEDHLDLLVGSIADNGGRSCLNASSVWLPSRGREVAEALARRVASIEARPLDDPQARLAAFPDAGVARKISEFIDRQLAVPGAEDVTAAVRPGGRLVELGGCSFLLPTIVHCSDPGHPLAACEFLFPFAAVVEAPREQLLERIGPTLVVTALTDDAEFRRELLGCRHVDRLNLGPIPTTQVSWDQPHEGNLFEHLYRRRALAARTDLAPSTRTGASPGAP